MGLKRFIFQADDDGTASAPSTGVRIFNVLAVLLLLSAATVFAFATLLDYSWNWQGVWKYRQLFINGWLMTLAIAIPALVLSCAIGLLVALGQQSRVLPVRYLCKIYVEIVRGSPLLVQILFLYYGVFSIFGLQNATVAGVVILSIFAGAYISEMIRAGIESITGSQLESGKAVGFTSRQMFRYIIFPQAFRQTLPALTGQAASLIKDSSLLSIIAISELTLNAEEVASVTLRPFESYLPLAFGYLIVTLPISWWSRRLEDKFRYES